MKVIVLRVQPQIGTKIKPLLEMRSNELDQGLSNELCPSAFHA
jgi:hypothetical protein